ncbi:MAG TPA: methylated-DNA--[protein]-cysteine S-methyltransferase [Burkholderiales bacterium]|nr:methylated-DNA--[protein]-cysteine S-methyltransferase [Burkholderiales bacterium]
MPITEKARNYLDSRKGERVTLDELARAVGASPFHLQREFKRAFGVSPYAYQDSHRVESVKRSLRNGSRVADAVFEAGYGSISRFYEKSPLGMAARDYRAKGKGQQVSYSCFASPIGTVLLAVTAKGLCSVKIGDDPERLRRQLAEELREAQLTEKSLPELQRQFLSFIRGEASLARVPLDIRGTVFQRRVWRELQRIPRGATRTYAEIARAIGAPDAVRAVGSACGANPVALAVPCHRAVRTDGGLGGYAWGLQRKKRLLQLEKGKKG